MTHDLQVRSGFKQIGVDLLIGERFNEHRVVKGKADGLVKILLMPTTDHERSEGMLLMKTDNGVRAALAVELIDFIESIKQQHQLILLQPLLNQGFLKRVLVLEFLEEPGF